MEERLRKFAVLVDAGSYTKASQDLHISQPALSTAISKLERELHAELLIHGNRNLKLTKAGKLAYDSAKELGIVSSNLKTRIADLLHDNPNLSIGMIDSVANVLFASKEAVEDIDKNSKISIVVNNSRYLASAVDRDEIDVAFITDRPARNDNKFIFEPIADEPLVLVCHSKDIKKVNAGLNKSRIENFISYDQASATYRLIDAELQKRKISYSPTYVSNSPAVAMQLVLLQKGAAFLPYVLVKYYIDNGQVTIAGDEAPFVINRPINLIKRRGKLPLAIVTSISDNLAELLDAYYVDIKTLR